MFNQACHIMYYTRDPFHPLLPPDLVAADHLLAFLGFTHMMSIVQVISRLLVLDAAVNEDAGLPC